jgi:predicted enzyme related to lactoylglutathione lyase
MGIKYVHTNIIARDWKKLSDFYIEVFGCRPVYPERDLSGEWIEKMTDIENVRIRGMHLSLPGYENGPTLEIFQCDPESPEYGPSKVNKQGFRHIAFHVDNVEEVLEKAMKYGGQKVGGLIEKQYETLGLLTAIYIADPEGNIVEIQNWKK